MRDPSNPADGPLVSVVIPTHNRRAALQLSLESALGQIDVPVEVVVVDDGSQDDTPTWLATIVDRRVTVIRNRNPGGVARARNAGIAAARGAWVAFLDDDDLWAPTKLRDQLEAASRKACGVVYSGALQTDERHVTTAVLNAPSPEDATARILEYNVIPAGQSNVVVRKEVLCEVGGFDENLIHLADWDMWIRLLQASPVCVCPALLVAYVVHSGGMAVGGGGEKLADLEQLRHKHAAIATAMGTSIGGEDFLGWVIWGHRRAGERRAAARLLLRRGLRYRRRRDLARAGGVLLGERAMALGQSSFAIPPEPSWIRDFRAAHGGPGC